MDLADGDPIFCWKNQCPPRSALQAVKLRLSRFPPTFPQVMLFYSIYSTSEFERLCVMTATSQSTLSIIGVIVPAIPP